MSSDSSISAEASLVAARAKAVGLTQLEIAAFVGASQSQVSRILAGVGARRSKLFDRVCKYVFSVGVQRSDVVPQENAALMAALSEVWDGSDAHASALALVIRSLAGLTSTKHPVRIGGGESA